MLKILEQCLKRDPESKELYMVQQVMISNSLNDLRVISGKALLN